MVHPLLGDLHTCYNVSIPSDSERSEVLEDKELVYVHEGFLIFVCLQYIVLDLIPQVQPLPDILCYLWFTSTSLHEAVSIVLFIF